MELCGRNIYYKKRQNKKFSEKLLRYSELHKSYPLLYQVQRNPFIYYYFPKKTCIMLADSYPFFKAQLKYCLLCEAGTDISSISQTEPIPPSIFAYIIPRSLLYTTFIINRHNFLVSFLLEWSLQNICYSFFKPHSQSRNVCRICFKLIASLHRVSYMEFLRYSWI